MAGNQENILVEFDYNNITIIDPNKVIDDNGKAKERVVQHENLVMYANLECKVIPRTKLALGVANNDAQQTISLATINFLKPGDKNYLTNNYTDEITGKDTLKGFGTNQFKSEKVTNPNKSNDEYLKQSLISNGKPGAVDNGLLGITNIQIRQNTSFLTTITISLEDVKGRALFEGGNNSPYAAFFNLPYPLFYLTIKGYYGKAVRLPIMLTRFNARYDTYSGNFKIELNFYTYKYSILNEITMAGLIATPHMYKSRLKIQTKSGNASQFSDVNNEIYERGYQKIREMYSEYKSKGLIPDDFPEITLVQMQNRIENFIKNVLDSFSKENLDSLTNLEIYQTNLIDYGKDVFYIATDSWFNKYMDTKNFFINNVTKDKLYTFKPEINTPDKKEKAISELDSLIKKYNGLLESNKTLGVNAPYYQKINISKDTFIKELQFSDIDYEQTYRETKGTTQPLVSPTLDELKAQYQKSFNSVKVTLKDGTIETKTYFFVFEGKNNFIDILDNLSKNVKTTRETIETELTQKLASLVQKKDSGIGFIPNIRNVLAVVFASGEAFLRLMDEVHTNSWNQRNHPYRKAAIFDKQLQGVSADNLTSGDDKTQPVYPWPQFIVETTGEKGQEKYEITYPADPKVISRTKAYLWDIWPEVEFVEEFIKGFIERTYPSPEPTTNNNLVTDVQRISFDAIEFPVQNNVYSNKEEVKYFFEIFERLFLVSNYSKLSRSNNFTSDSDKITKAIAEVEKINIVKSLSNDNPFIIKKLKQYGINSTNFLEILRAFSNEGVGESWQNLIRGYYNASYIKNLTENSEFEFINYEILNNSIAQPKISSTTDEDNVNEYVTGSTNSNKFDLTDIFPFTNDSWDKTYLANGQNNFNATTSFNTTKVLKYNSINKVISSFITPVTVNNIRPITNFIYIQVVEPNVNKNTDLKSFYVSRSNDVENQLFTEGNVKYFNYTGYVSDVQTTSIFNSPYFINSIQQGVQNFKNFDEYPYKAAAYLFLNSLPLATLKEKFKTYDNKATKELDYIFAVLKKFGAIHKLPYAWILKIGSIWHRYKTYQETNVDIINTSWSGFSYVNNFDPLTNNPSKTYGLTINNFQYDIVLEQNLVLLGNTSTFMNTGFYPKLINDFNVFYQGFDVFSGYTTNLIQSGLSSTMINYVQDAVINFSKGFDDNNLNRDLTIVPWSIMVDTPDKIYSYIMPSNGSVLNQTLNECFNSGKLKIEVLSNQSVYDGSVRLFWSAPNYGYFDNSKIVKPTTFDYMKEIFSDKTKKQENFSLNGNPNNYSKTDEILSVFEKNILDKFETEFLNFSKSIYDFEDSPNVNIPSFSVTPTETEKSFRNFQMLFRNLMKIAKVKKTLGKEIILDAQTAQFKNINNILTQFMNYDVVFKFGNPSNFDRRLFYTFSSLPLVDPYGWESYTSLTPNALPTQGGNVTLTTSQTAYKLAWSTLYTYVGFSEIPELQYKNSGSYITDFFVDLNIAFTSDNIIKFAPIIKIYATQKLNQFQSNFIPPPPPPISSPSQIVATAKLLTGTTINVNQKGPDKFGIARNSAGIVIFTSVDYDSLTNNQKIVDDIIKVIYGKTSTVPTDPQYVVDFQNNIQPTYPLIPNPTTFNGLNAFYLAMTNYLNGIVEFQNKVTDNLFIKLQKDLPNVNNVAEPTKPSDLEGPQTKVELWESFKAINDKWISGTDFKTKTLFEDVLLLDRASRDIGDKVLVDIFKLKDEIKDLNPKNTMLGFVQSILIENHFVVMNIPSYVNFYNVQDATKNPKPRIEGTTEFANTMFGTHLNVDYRESTSKLVCFYGGKPSEQLAVNENVDYRYRNDAFELTRASLNPLIENQTDKKDWYFSNKVVGFNVDIGTQNQQIFKHFQVGQENGQATAESLEIINYMANQAGNRGGATQNISLYNLYKNRSYSCSVTMMGNALIQPTMYFNLRHVPMFSGPYMILEVNHSIQPGNFETYFTGIRQPIASLPKIDSYLQTIKTNLLQGIVERNKELKSQQTSSSTATTQQVQTKITSVFGGDKELVTNQDCKSIYSNFYSITPQLTRATFNDVFLEIKNAININVGSDDGKLKYCIFAALYAESGNETNFQSYENNYSGIDLTEKISPSQYFESNKQFYCLKSKSIVAPYAVFSDLTNNVVMLVNKWKLKMGNVNDNSAKSIAKFIILNQGGKSKSENVYLSFNKTDLANIETKVQKSIDIWNAMR